LDQTPRDAEHLLNRNSKEVPYENSAQFGRLV
jgi:hypothetical protein